VVAGEMTIMAEDQRNTYNVGESFSMPHGCRHSEQAGPAGATYVAGRRKPN
jgi:quercetin dioxygenase-like cupin family protein